MKVLLPLFASVLLLGGCAVGPNYQRPKVNLPPAYAGPINPPTTATASSLGNEKWWEVFGDPVLQQLIRTALERNYDVRIAATRVLQAQSQLGITRSYQLPAISASASAITERNPKVSSVFPAYEENAGELDASLIWNLDFWGKYRRQTEAARDAVLASEWGRRTVLTSVVSEVATSYFQLRELDLAIDLSLRTLASRKDELRLTQVLLNHGSASLLEVDQAQELVDTAAATIVDLERQMQQQQDLISELLGENPGPVARGRKLTDEPLPASVPSGLPSELLERRPDIREAEANLMAANADIGAARASFLPSITLTATGGFESYALSTFFSGQSVLWNAVAGLTQPIFQAGALRAGLRLTEAQKEQMLLTYQQTIVEAVREVSDALVAYQKNQQFRAYQASVTQAATDANRLSHVLYQHGSVSYLQVLTSETNQFAAELNLAQAELNERLALVELYNALGGGWQQ